MDQLHVLIVGAGIAGLAAARALKKLGHRVEIFERSSLSNEVGAAVTISPNGSRVLSALDFDFAKADGVHLQQIRRLDAKTLAPISIADYGPDVESRCGAPWRQMHRRDMHKTLWDLALADAGSAGSVDLYAGVTVVKVDTDNARIELNDGRKFACDLLIGADGLRSQVRTAALGDKSQPIDTEFQIYRFLLPTEAIVDDPETRELYEMKGDKCMVLADILDSAVDTDLRVVWYGCRGGKVQNFGCLYRGERDEVKVEDFGHPADKTRFLELFDGVHPKFKLIFQKAEEITYWRVYERLPLSTFVYGRTLLIGDAGHPMTPFTAAGAVQALEDVGALYGLFSNISSQSDLEARMKMYDSVRLVRASRIQTGASTRFKDGSPNPLTEAHKELLKIDDMPEDQRERDSLDPKRHMWEYSYNVFEHCKKSLNDIREVSVALMNDLRLDSK